MHSQELKCMVFWFHMGGWPLSWSGSVHPTSFMVKLFCSQRQNITLMLRRAASFLRDTCLTLRKTVACPAKPKYKPFVAGLEQPALSRAVAKYRKIHKLKKNPIASLNPDWVHRWRSRENRRATACWSPSRSLYAWEGGRSSVPPVSLHPLWDIGGGKNKGRRWKARGAPRLLLPLWEAAKPNAVEKKQERIPPHAWPTATHCAIPLQWTIGHMGRRQQEKGTGLLTFLPPLPRQSTPYMTKKWAQKTKKGWSVHPW